MLAPIHRLPIRQACIHVIPQKDHKPYLIIEAAKTAQILCASGVGIYEFGIGMQFMCEVNKEIWEKIAQYTFNTY